MHGVCTPRRRGGSIAHGGGSEPSVRSRVSPTRGMLRLNLGGRGPGRKMRRMVDARDLEILAVLQQDARATYAEVARQVGLSTSSVHQRVRRLEEGGVIRGYRAVVDPQAVGLNVTALVSVSPLDPKQPDDLPERVTSFPEIEDCYSVAGDENYVLKVRTRTTADLEDLLRRIREEGGVRTQTTVVLSIPFEERPMNP